MKLTKPQKALAAMIESEGGKILSFKRGRSHLQCDYTFDDTHAFTASLSYGSNKSVDRRWLLNFRAEVRKNKRQLEN